MVSLPSQLFEAPRDYRRKSLGIALLLLVVWSAVTFGIPFFARQLGFQFLGWPFSFWLVRRERWVCIC